MSNLKAKYLDLNRAIGNVVELITEQSDEMKRALENLDIADEALQKEIYSMDVKNE